MLTVASWLTPEPLAEDRTMGRGNVSRRAKVERWGERGEMAMKSEERINCAKCSTVVCLAGRADKAPSNCPTTLRPKVIEAATERCLSPEILAFAREASRQEAAGYARLAHAPNVPSPIKSRLEEIMEFSERMGYRKLGVAFCVGARNEAEMLVSVLENRGFEVVSVCCKCGMVAKEELGVVQQEQIFPENEFETMCHPIAQAQLLNDARTDFNVVLCLCVGHDSLFLKHSEAPCTVLAAKDRLLGHNPLAALYLSKSYYRRVRT
jgi:uncharacterized metal-binding protein